MKKIILPLLLSIFFHAAFAQEDEGVEIGGVTPKKVKFKPLQTGGMATEIQLPKENIMYVIDGVPFFEGNIPAINPEDIASVDVLTKDALPRIGCRPGAGKVIIITTKSKMLRTQVTDQLNGQPVPNASVHLVFKQKNKPDKMIIADSAGYFTVEDKLLNRVAVVYVSSVGYHERTLSKEYIGKEIKLEPKFNDLQPVVIRSFTFRCPRHECCILNTITTFPLTKIKKKVVDKSAGLLPALPNASVFPNPVSRGNALQVKITAADKERLNITLLSVSGQPVYQANHATNKGANQVSIQLPQQIAAGVYMLVAKNEQGKMLLNRSVVVE